MNPELWRSSVPYHAPYVHSWPGKPKNRGTCKHTKARKQRAIARHN